MSILSVQHVWSGESWDDGVEGQRGYTALYRVISNDPTESPQAVRAAVALPGTAYPTDASAFLKTRSATRSAESRLVWDVTLNYEFDPQDPNEPVENPLNEPIKFRWTSQQYTVAAIKDRNGDAIVNSAGDYFDPPPEVEESRWSVNVQCNLAAVPVAVLTYAGRVNNGGFEIDGVSIQEGEAKIIAMDISEVQEKNDISFRVFTYTLEFREEGWELEALDQGLRINDEGTLKDIMIEDEDGGTQRASSPVLLNGSGAQLSNPTPDNAVFLAFPTPKLLDYSSLPGVVTA